MFGSNRKNDAEFFTAFAEHASKSVAAAKLLVEMMEHLEAGRVDDATRDLATRIKALESEGDMITHQTIKQLREHWITPLDRTDIHELISRLDDVLDNIEEAAERAVLFDVEGARPEAVELTRIVHRACEAIATAVGLLTSMKNAPKILELCVEVNRLENTADQVHRRALGDLFKAGNDALLVMKWRDILESLESAADDCEDVANIVEGVVLEYG
jgi:uncharacterized protein